MQIQSPILKVIGVALGVLLTSFFFFPVEFVFLPTNTKKIMAAVGIALFVYDVIRGKVKLSVDKYFIFAIILALGVSAMSYATMAENNTKDTEFVSYVVSLFVWIGGAYTALFYVRAVHGKLTLDIAAHYLVGVVVFQCVLAYLISVLPGLKEFVGSISTSQSMLRSGSELEKAERLYGLGCALDPAGLRMAGVLIVLSFLIEKDSKGCSADKLMLYISAFVIIAVFGNMISRSTTIGIILGLVYMLANTCLHQGRLYLSNGRLWKFFLGGIAIVVIVCTIAYNTNEDFAALLEFGFEGFFSLFRRGEWDVGSNNILVNMVVWPDNIRTWIIGDGYIGNPWEDLNYIGAQFGGGYYMETDIGYCRYIFYFGIIGLAILMLMFAFFTLSLCKYFPDYKWMFVLLLLSNYIGWMKVTSDIVMIFAAFLMTAVMQTPEEDSVEQQESESVEDKPKKPRKALTFTKPEWL